MADPIGQILQQMGVLTEWQVEQVLGHQAHSGQKFGQIAVAWGWAKPEEVWEAWARQLCSRATLIDLDEFGIDTKAVRRVSPGIAQRYKVIPVRAWGEHLVLAVSQRTAQQASQELPDLVDGSLHFCTARDEQIDAYLEKIYLRWSIPTPQSC